MIAYIIYFQKFFVSPFLLILSPFEEPYVNTGNNDLNTQITTCTKHQYS